MECCPINRVDNLICQPTFLIPGATLAEVDYREGRGDHLGQDTTLCRTWRSDATNLLIVSPTGGGETYLACARAIYGRQSEHSLLYYRRRPRPKAHHRARRHRPPVVADNLPNDVPVLLFPCGRRSCSLSRLVRGAPSQPGGYAVAMVEFVTPSSIPKPARPHVGPCGTLSVNRMAYDGAGAFEFVDSLRCPGGKAKYVI